jgi:hypothetical protein
MTASAPKLRNSVGINSDFGAPEALALRLGVSKPGFHPLNDQTTLQLCYRAKNGKDHLAGRGAGVELFGERNELYALGSKRFQGSKQMAH